MAEHLEQPEDLHDQLRWLRQTARITVEMVADHLGVSATAIRSRERGERAWYPDLVSAYVAAVRHLDAQRGREVAREARTLLSRWPGRSTDRAARRARQARKARQAPPAPPAPTA